MATIVKRNCPECGARLQINAEIDYIKCEYCGTVSRIESKKPKGPPPPDTKKTDPVIFVSTGARSGVWVFSTMITLAVVGVTMWTVFSQVSGSIGKVTTTITTRSSTGPGSGGSSGQSAGEHMQWVGYQQPMLVDLTGDGVMDVVGWIRFLNTTGGTSQQHLAAFNSVTGDRIWVTGPIAETGQATHCKVAMLADKLVVSDPAGQVKAHALATGAPVWQAVVGERVDAFCGGPAGQVVAHLKDKRALGIALATGQVTPAGQVTHKTPCPPIQGGRTEVGPFFSVGGGTWDDNGIVNPKLEGMRSDKVLVDKVTGNTIALGHRQPGTRTPMAALYKLTQPKKKKATALWMANVSPVNPLTVEEGSPEKGAVAQGRVLVPYGLQGSKAGGKLSCLDENTGRILWDVPIPRSDAGKVGGVTASQHHVFVSHWTYLDIFQLVDGAHKMTIGVW